MLHNSFEEARRLDERWKTETYQALEATQKFQSQWNAENTQLEEQRRYAEQVHLEEQRKAEIARLDMELARKLQREWGNRIDIQPKPRDILQGKGMHRGLTGTLRSQKQIEFEKQRKLEEKENLWGNSSTTETRDRTGVKINFSKLMPTKQPPVQRQNPTTQQIPLKIPNLYAKHQNAPPLLDCLACMETFKMTQMCVLTCHHAYCKDCTKGSTPYPFKLHI